MSGGDINTCISALQVTVKYPYIERFMPMPVPDCIRGLTVFRTTNARHKSQKPPSIAWLLTSRQLVDPRLTPYDAKVDTPTCLPGTSLPSEENYQTSLKKGSIQLPLTPPPRNSMCQESDARIPFQAMHICTHHCR